jgi:hypothetical protein
MSRKKINKVHLTKLQIFALVAWLVIAVMLTYDFIIESFKIETYVLSMVITTGLCLTAWGLFLFPIDWYGIFRGKLRKHTI